MKEYCLTVQYKCNWKCDYCIVDTHSQKEITKDELIHKLEIIEPGSEVSITGGEPGLISKELLEFIFSELKKKHCQINVNTNGTFFEKYPEYYQYIQNYLYHCSEHLDLSIPIIIPDNPDNKIDYLLVVTDNTYQNIEEFIKKYPNILFHIYAADPVMVNGQSGKFLSKQNAFKIIKQFKDRIHPNSYKSLFNISNVANKNLNYI